MLSSTMTYTSQSRDKPDKSSFTTNAILTTVILAVISLINAAVMAIIIFLWIKQKTQKEKLRIKPVIQIKTSTNVSYDRVSCNTNRVNIEDGCYVEIGKKCETDNNQNSSNVATNLSSTDDYNDFQDIDQLYAVVDKSTKVRKPLQVDANEDSHASDMLSIVNYKDMKFEFEDVTDLYAVVDKSAKKRKAKEEDLPEELYAVVDEANKK